MALRKFGGLVKKQISLAAILFLFLPFQNCSQVNFFGNSSKVLDFKSENNGIGYGGKPDYYRLVPDFTCERKVAPAAFIHESDPTATLTENKKLACGVNQQTLDIALIDHSIYQRDIVGYNEGIYEGSDSTPESIPANLVEVWCRDKKDETGIESITHYNRATHQGVTRIFYSTPVANGMQTVMQHRQSSEFSVSRVISPIQITLQGENNFHLEVYRDQPAQQLGLFKGSMTAVIEGRSLSLETSCRLGGSFDPKIWPVAQVVDSNIYMFQMAPDLNSFAFSSRTGSQSNAWNLFDSDILGKTQKQVSSNLLASGATNFIYSADSSTLFYWGDTVYARIMSLFKVNVDGSQASLVRANASKHSREILSSGDGKRVLFKAEDPNNQNLMSILQSVPLNGGQPLTLNLLLPHLPEYGVFDFEVSKSTNRVAFLSGYLTSPELYITDVDGANLVKPVIRLPSQTWSFNLSQKNLVVPDPGQFVIVHAMSIQRGIADTQEYVVSIDGATVLTLPINLKWVSSSPDGFKLLLVDGQKNYGLYDLQTSSFASLVDFKNAEFSLDSKWIVGTKSLQSGKVSVVTYSILDAQQTVLCSGADGDSVKILEDENHQLYIASLDSFNKIIRFFVKPANGSCEQATNNLPITSQWEIAELAVSPDKVKLLVHMSESGGFKIHDSIAYVPLDGKPALMINTPLYFGARIKQVQFLKDSRTILYIGDQLNMADDNAFLWHAPSD